MAGPITIDPGSRGGRPGPATGTARKPDEQIRDAGTAPVETGSADRPGGATATRAAQTGPEIVIDGNAPGTGGTGKSGTANPGTEFELPKRRGRPPGSTNSASTRSRSKKPEALSVDAVQFSLASIHALLAVVAKNPALDLSKNETLELAKAITNVQQHYPVAVDPKFAAWAHLISVAGLIYVPRVMMARKKPAQDPKGSAYSEQKPQPAPVQEPAPGPKKQSGGNMEGMSPSELYGPLHGRG